MEKVLNDEAFPTATKRDLDRMWSRRCMMSRCGHSDSELQDREHIMLKLNMVRVARKVSNASLQAQARDLKIL